MTIVSVEPTQASGDVLRLLEQTVQAEIERLALACEVAGQRLKPFEAKYKVSSEMFIAQMTAEDLDGGDDEYVAWAGEYKLLQHLLRQIAQLKELRFVNPS